MEHSNYPVFRSASLPSHTALALSTTPEPSLFRRDSDCMLSDGPITPPLSPGRSEEGEAAIIVDSEPRYSGPGSQLQTSLSHPHLRAVEAARRGSHSHQQDGMDVDTRPLTSSPRPPQRHLEDEQSHLEKGTLKLTDFEVKGTLGEFCSMTSLRPIFVMPRATTSPRHWHVRASPACAASGLVWADHVKLLRTEGAPQDRNRPAATGRACERGTVHPITHTPSFHRRPLRNFPGQPQRLHVNVLCSWRRAVHTPASG